MTRCKRALLTLALALATAACGRGDESVEFDVRSRLIIDDTTSGADVTVAVTDGIVHLSGAVRTQRQHARVLEIAREVVGADNVIDETRVDEAPLARAVREAVGRDPLVAAVPVEIDATDRGVVFLRSTQTNAEQRRRLLQIARGVDGVSGVEDEMK